MQQGPIGIQSNEDGDDGLQREARDSLFVLARIRAEGQAEAVTVRVRNVSSGGLMAQASEAFQTGIRVEVELDGVGHVMGVVAWSEAGRIGIAFDHPVDKQRARKSGAPKPVGDDMLMRIVTNDFRRPPLKPR